MGLGLSTGTGAIQAGSAASPGTGISASTGTGILVAQSASVAGGSGITVTVFHLRGFMASIGTLMDIN